MKFRMFASAAALALLGGGTAQALSVTYYSDRAAFQDALLFFTLETFDGNRINAPFLSITGDDVSFANNMLTDVIDDDADVSTTFSFGSAVSAFGGDFDLAGPGGPGTGISVTLADGSTVDLGTEIPSTSAGFWGFTVSDYTFTDVLFSEGTLPGSRESYSLDRLTYGLIDPTSATPVPLPAGLPLLAVGLAGFGLIRRKRAD